MVVEAQISRDNYSKQLHMVASLDNISAQLYRWTINMELRYAGHLESLPSSSLVPFEILVTLCRSIWEYIGVPKVCMHSYCHSTKYYHTKADTRLQLNQFVQSK